jgi:hypothetical protein
MKTITKWVSALAFDATADTGHTVRIDTGTEGGGPRQRDEPEKNVAGIAVWLQWHGRGGDTYQDAGIIQQARDRSGSRADH